MPRSTPPPAPAALVLPWGWQIEGLPATVRRAGPQAAERTVEFFTAQIRNPHTRAAYDTAVTRFFNQSRLAGRDAPDLTALRRLRVQPAQRAVRPGTVGGRTQQTALRHAAASTPGVGLLRSGADAIARAGTLPVPV